MSPEIPRSHCPISDCPAKKDSCATVFIDRVTLSKKFEVSPNFIKRYEERGLLTPQFCSVNPNLVLYNEDQITRLIKIKYLRDNKLEMKFLRSFLPVISFESLPQEYQDKFNSLQLRRTPDIIER